MQKVLILVIAALTTFSLISCKKKEREKEGYEKVLNNIYKSEDYLFHFIDSEKSHFYYIYNNVIDSSLYDVAYYQVDGDTLKTNFMKGRILEDRLLLRLTGSGEDIIFLKQ